MIENFTSPSRADYLSVIDEVPKLTDEKLENLWENFLSKLCGCNYTPCWNRSFYGLHVEAETCKRNETVEDYVKRVVGD